MKKALVTVLTIALIVTLFSCSGSIDSKEEYGMLSIATESNSGRTILPPSASITVAKYHVYGHSLVDTTKTKDLTATGSPISIDQMLVGDWTISVVGQDASGNDITEVNTQTITIVATQTTNASYALEYASGTGSLSYSVSIPSSLTAVSKMIATLTSVSNDTDVHSVTMLTSSGVVSGTTRTITGTLSDLTTGYYTLVLRFYDSSDTELRTPKMDSVGIFKNLASSTTISISEAELPVEAPTITASNGSTTVTLTDTITLASTTADVACYYTIDGTTPTLSSTKYSTPFTIDHNRTIKAIAYREDMSTSPVSSQSFTILAASPTVSIAAGTYADEQSVVLSTTTTGSTIHYTIDGTEPTNASTTYTSAITISKNMTLKAVTVNADFSNSGISVFDYKIKTKEPVSSLRAGTYSGTQTITLSSATDGAIIYYTLDGTEPTASSSSLTNGSTLSVSSSMTVKCLSLAPNYIVSDTTVYTYTILSTNQVETPTISVSDDVVMYGQTVSLVCATSGSTIYYTMDGTEPNATSSVYSGEISLVKNCTLKAYAIKEGYPDSLTVSKIYSVKVPTPTFTPSAGPYSTAQSVSITCAISNATIHYTIDGVEPTSSGTIYTAPFDVATTTTVKAIATLIDCTTSDTATTTYTINGISGLTISNPTNPSSYSLTINLPEGWDNSIVKSHAIGIATYSVTPTVDSVQYETWFDGNKVETSALGTFYFGITPDAVILNQGVHELVVKATTSGNTLSTSRTIKSSSSGLFDCKASIVSQNSSTFLMLSDGNVGACGFNNYGQLGNGNTVDQKSLIPIMTDVKSISIGFRNTFFLKTDNSVWACGYNNYGQLGTGNTTNQYSPVQVLTDVESVIASASNTFFIKQDNTVWTCGYNNAYQLGTGNTTNQYSPVQVLTGVKSVLAGGFDTFFIKEDNSVWVCGSNSCGQLGTGNTSWQTTIKQVITDIKSVISDDYSTFFVKNDNSVWACGQNNYGQLGTGNTTNQSSIKQVLSDVDSIIIGERCFSTYFLKNDNSVWACGQNNYGQLGTGNTTNQTSPVQVMTNVKSVVTNGYSTFFLKNDNSVWACGYNNLGQLGTGNTTNQTSPVQVMTDVNSVVSSESSTFFLKNDNSIWACGYNNYGQLVTNDTSLNQCLPLCIVCK